MKATVRLGAALAALALLAVACAAPQTERSGDSGGPTNATADKPAENDAPVRDFSVTTFSGKDFTLSAQGGAPVVLNFFESW
ncbi:MAG: hypothetical protein M3454_13520 [Actinomycetota bacterium]|nr:hypothetical protein [Actinomycetota bacterium]